MASEQDIEAALDKVKVRRRRADAARLVAIMQEVTGEEPVLWPGNIIGFGAYHYRYASGREGDTVKVGFAPRASALVLYGLIQRYGEDADSIEDRDLLDRLGESTSAFKAMAHPRPSETPGCKGTGSARDLAIEDSSGGVNVAGQLAALQQDQRRSRSLCNLGSPDSA
jgi:hypothetical protein